MYLTDRGESGAGIVGSSNFTQRGLGGGGFRDDFAISEKERRHP